MPPLITPLVMHNQFRPTSMTTKPYGWSRPQYNRADVPTARVPNTFFPGDAQKILAYEWLNSGTLPNSGYANPPFTSGAAGRLHPLLISENGQSARILRGYIRRATFEAGDEVTKARLYFMYNPEQITRDYVSYLDQQALDPFNTVYQSGNLVAPPSFMDFSFDLFFDRQTEAGNPDHPGVFVDYQFFDLVVRNVIPTDPNATSNTLPDNGVMMVNPRDITVVFSPQLTVQGRPLNARVTFEKFTHRMTPVRMRISLTMRVLYFGPMREQTEYRMEKVEYASKELVPADKSDDFKITYETMIVKKAPKWTDMYKAVDAINAALNAGAAAIGGYTYSGEEGKNIVPVAGIAGGVDKGIAPNVARMISDARFAGVTLTGGGYRSTAQQVKLRQEHCNGNVSDPHAVCHPPTAAVVGGKSHSEHTKGLAIDFENCPRGGTRFNWLKANAARYGFKNLPSESWHWSTTGK